MSLDAPLFAWGVDGCKGGWFYVAIDQDGASIYGVVKKLAEIVDRADSRDRVFADVPIGLPDGRLPRKCDVEARDKLGPRRSSVFPVPARATLDATSYREACHVNAMVTGRKISQQTYAILPKIDEVDALMQRSQKARAIVSEVHPEVCFWGLAGLKPMANSKRTQAGYEERLAVLCGCWPGAAAVVERVLASHPRRKVARSDILDAIVAALTARAKTLRRLPVEPQQDATGLPMQMVWTVRENFGWRDLPKLRLRRPDNRKQTRDRDDGPIKAEVDWAAMIASGESHNREFKATLRTNLHTGRKDPRIEHAVLKTMAAFLNTRGGSLFIGVADDGTPAGIDQDGFGSEDKMGVHLSNIGNARLGGIAMTQIRLEFVYIGDVRVLVVDCPKSHRPVYLKDGSGERFYVRTGVVTFEMQGAEMRDYIAHRFDSESASE